MYMQEEEYPANTKELVGGYVSTKDGSSLVAAQVTLAVLASTVTNPPIDTVWHTPAISSQVTDSKVKVAVMIGPGQTYTLTPGRYRVWFNISDAPEIPWRPHHDTFKVV